MRYFCLGISLLSGNVLATEMLGPEVGVVPYGMGRAYSAVADDWLAAHYNPAGLAMVNSVDIQIFDLKMGTNQDVRDTVTNMKSLNGSGSMATALNSFVGRHLMFEGANVSQVTMPNSALGVNYNLRGDLDLQNAANPVINMRYTKDFSLYGAGAISVGAKKQLRLGLKFDLVKRTGGVGSISTAEIVGNKTAIVDKFSNQGTGIAGTFGVQYQLPFESRTEITTSFVWHDIGNTAFGGHSDSKRPSTRKEMMVAGMGARIPIGGRKNRRAERRYGPSRSTNALTFAFDYSQLNTGINKEHFPKHCHLGMNLDLPILSLQLGLNQTSLTAGTTFDIGLIKIALATYGEELGSYGGQRRDRRYLLSIGSSVSFKGF